MTRPLLLALLLSVPAFPAQAIVMRAPHACSMEAMQCPDGSYVSRTGPNCEFAPCPGGAAPVQPKPVPPPTGGSTGGGAPGVAPGSDGETGSGESGEGVSPPGVISSPGGVISSPGVISPDTPPALPDEPLEAPQGAQSVKFVVEHRTALNDQQVTVHGIVISALLADKACPPDRGMCAQPRVTIADSSEETRNKAYDVEVILPEGDKTPYAPGQIVDLTGTVSGSEGGVLIQKK